MNNRYIILLLLFLLSVFNTGNSFAQVVVERSSNRVTIGGIPYYVHIVRKGETLYSVSRAYNVTVEEIIRENPPAVKGINEGQALRIPVREAAPVTPQASPYSHSVKDETRFVYHVLQPGQTIYSLSKLYGVSENDIVNANPGIEISRLPVRSEIAIPRKDFMTAKQDFAIQETGYIFHKVVSGESMASIAEKYGMTLRELRRENRNMRFPQVGDYIRIPSSQGQEIAAEETVTSDSVVVAEPDIEVIPERASSITPVGRVTGSFEIAVLLPFYLSENAQRTEIDSSRFIKGKRQYKLVTKPPEWIYNRSNAFVEMYEGILLAADTLVSLGLNVNVITHDIKADTAELVRLINSNAFENTDLIIGPVYSSNLNIISRYASKRKIPVVSPVRLFDRSALKGNPFVYMANPSLSVAQDIITGEACKNYNSNFVFIHTDTAGTDQEVNAFRNKLINRLTQYLPYEEIRFREFYFYSRSVFGNDSINRLAHSLSPSNENIIIVASEDDPVISETIQEIHALSKKFRINPFVYPLIRGLENLDSKYLFDLNLLVYSPFWIDYSRNDVKAFNRKFRQLFLSEPSEMSYAWLGYDIAYYFLSGMAVHGKEFLERPGMHNPDLLQTEFDFFRSDPEDGFENRWLYHVRYSSDYKLRLDSSYNQAVSEDID